jgi:transcriptional regulator with XRE-family HTH domain
VAKQPPKDLPPERQRRPGPDPATLGGRIFLARQAKELTLEDVGKACGVSPQAVGQWEKNEARPTTRRLERLAGVLEMTLSRLINEAPPSLADVAGRLEIARAQVAEITDDDGPLPMPAHVLEAWRRRLVHVGEIRARDWRPGVQDLRVLPEYSLWAVSQPLLPFDVISNNVRVIRVVSGDMAPTLAVADYAVIDAEPSPVAAARGIYFLTEDDTFLCRRIVLPLRTAGGETIYRLAADNKDVSSRDVPAAKVRLLGRVIGRITMGAL